VRGNPFLIQLGLAVFYRYKGISFEVPFNLIKSLDKILSINIDELGNFFRHDLRDISDNDVKGILFYILIILQ